MTEKKQSLVIVGNGMATGRLLDELIKRDVSRFNITVIGDERQGSYNRIMLSPVLAGETDVPAIIGKPSAWYRDRGIRFVSGVQVKAIEREQKCVLTTEGNRLRYDHLVLAVGSRPAKIPAENQALEKIYSFRTLRDVDRLLNVARFHDRDARPTDTDALVIGGGLLGLEAAYGLALKGLRVTLVHRSGWLLNRQLDKTAAGYLQKVLEAKNIQFILSDEVVRFTGSHELKAAEFKSGRTLSCKLCVIATGITPNKELGLQAGLKGNRGVAVDAYMATSDNSISAIGECVEFKGATFGLVEPIWHQCTTLAERLCYNLKLPFENSAVPTKLKVSGVNLFSAGDFLTSDEHRELLYCDDNAGIYRKILLRDNRIVGAVLFGDTRDGQDYFAMLQSKRDVSDIAPFLLMGRAFYGTEPDQTAAA
ncbi:FAD-dependent oxidoreductase [Gilvimarinus sp. 2_MG-2023]|uniref:NAD(P)/FAD-dependent oxidoreductase n=1 Tax=Gilvimarinus sp. 2_MG-2023 TaxID=3062666 RepID=UPI0026E25887|nr:FAD-dependent oxidoreductase [Gilvimarinus sp. 2_MG-2023]MDO6569819.1 FAD-dependent oxidoreductase [Gilvimarinus sp. 2_MG-2023]